MQNVAPWHGQKEPIRRARLDAESDLRIFCLAQARGRPACRVDRWRDRWHALRIEFRRKSSAYLRLQCALVQCLARLARTESDRVGALALAVEKISQRVFDYPSRNHHPAHRIVDRPHSR